jgi:hypothetical protein
MHTHTLYGLYKNIIITLSNVILMCPPHRRVETEVLIIRYFVGITVKLLFFSFCSDTYTGITTERRRLKNVCTRGVFRLTSRRGGVTQMFSLIQTQNSQVKCLVIFKSGESLIFVVFFFFNLISDPLRIDFCVVLF